MRKLTLMFALAVVGFTMQTALASASELSPAADRMTAAVNKVTA